VATVVAPPPDVVSSVPSAASAPRRRYVSAISSTTPLSIRKIAVGTGFASTVRNVCSSSSPVRPTGMVARISSQASRSSAVSTLRLRIELITPPTIRTQSRQK
jgi:hypothetical protein